MPSISAMVRGPRIFRIAARQASAIAALRTSRGRAEAGQKSLARAVVADTMSTVVVEIDLRSAVEAVADTISTVVAEIDLTSAVEVVAEAISAAEVVDAAEAEADAAEADAAEAGDVRTSISSRTSFRLRSSTAVSNSIASATGTAIPRSMWASWRRTCRSSNRAQFGAHATDICGSTMI